jgi:DNA-binding HxlR family transcriptional regulator
LFFLSVRSQSGELMASAIAQDERWRYAGEMTRTHEKVRYSPDSKDGGYTPVTAASGVEQAFKFLEGRWKLVILFHLFGGNMLRFSELERAIPAISQKMLIQQLRQMESDGIVRRIVHHQVPPKVEYGLTDWGQALCPALDALLKWAAAREVRTLP